MQESIKEELIGTVIGGDGPPPSLIAAIAPDALLEACDRLPCAFATLEPDARPSLMNSAFRTLFNPSTPYTASAPDLARLAGGDARSLRSVDGQVWPVSTIRLGGGRILVTVEDRSAPTGMDLTERRDALTGLANRVVLKERIVQMLAEPGKDLQAALFLLDLDRIPK